MKTFVTLLAAAAVLLVNTAVRAADSPALGEPAKAVLEHYVKIQTQLAKDSIKGLDAQASAIAKAVNNDETKTFSPEVAKEAETLGKAKDLAAAREAFKPLSTSLIKFLADNKAGKGAYRQAFCPMANASWLQTGKDIRNPYMGKDMLDCGEFKD
jgi:hypothetical protein